MIRRSPPIRLMAGAVLLALPLTVAGRAAAQGSPPPVLIWSETLQGNEETRVRWPVAVAAASEDEILVADAFENRLMRFRRLGVSWQLELVVRLLGPPVALVADGDRYLASLRKGPGLVSIEGEEMKQRPIPLPKEVAAGPLAALPDGELLLYDYAGRRVLQMDGQGRQLGEVAIEGRVSALAPGPGGGFLAAIPAQAAIHRFSGAGKLAERWQLPGEGVVPAWPSGIAAETGGDLVVADRHGGRLLVLDALGRVKGDGSRRGWDPGLLLRPAGVALLPGGGVAVADQGNGRVQLFLRTDRSAGP